MNYPHLQGFSNKPRRHKAQTKAEARLDTRRHDYHKMIAQSKIAGGSRDSTGYKCPGSNKK